MADCGQRGLGRIMANATGGLGFDVLDLTYGLIGHDASEAMWQTATDIDQNFDLGLPNIVTDKARDSRGPVCLHPMYGLVCNLAGLARHNTDNQQSQMADCSW
eukprot:15187603-Ditylum_brightwellii.AAC.1